MISNPLDTIIQLPEGPERTARQVAWLQELYAESDAIPVLVGGAAVELYTGGAYTTGDIDFAGKVTASVSRRLIEAGFQKSGRHWVHEEAKLFIEFPSDALKPDEEAVILTVSGWKIRVVSPEDLLVDRLAAWKFWDYTPDGVNAYLLYKAHGERMNADRLQKAARKNKVEDALRSLISFLENISCREASQAELESWAGKVK